MEMMTIQINKSYWHDGLKQPEYSSLKGTVSCGTAVVGGGITGMQTLNLLADFGVDCILLEADEIGSGTTEQTTAKITTAHGLKYAYIADNISIDAAKAYYEVNKMGMKHILSVINDNKIKYDLKKVPSYIYAENDDGHQAVKREHEILKKLNIKSEITDEIPLPFPVKSAIKVEGQAQFHPLKYLYALSDMIDKKHNAAIYTKSMVVKIEKGSRMALHTDKGIVYADNVVVATNYPIIDMPGFLFTRLHQERSYILCCHADDAYYDGIFINTNDAVNSVRMHEDESGTWLMAGGYGHKTGEPSDIKGYDNLNVFLSDKLGVKVTDKLYRWSSQDSVTISSLPLIGSFDTQPNLYIATGYGKWGMTNSAAAALITAHSIVENDHPILKFKKYFQPNRNIISAALKPFLKQAADTIKNYTIGNIVDNDMNLSDIPPGEGVVIVLDGRKMAVYKDSDGKIKALEPYCTHLRCPIVFNRSERSWDCTCHGSRFSIDGNVISGPAKSPLKEIEYTKSE